MAAESQLEAEDVLARAVRENAIPGAVVRAQVAGRAEQLLVCGAADTTADHERAVTAAFAGSACAITVFELLTHTSGPPATINLEGSSGAGVSPTDSEPRGRSAGELLARIQQPLGVKDALDLLV